MYNNSRVNKINDIVKAKDKKDHYDKEQINIKKYQDNEYDYQDELTFMIRLSGYQKPLYLRLTFDNYKNQFKQFLYQFKLTKNQSKALKQIIKTRLSQLLFQNTSNILNHNNQIKRRQHHNQNNKKQNHNQNYKKQNHNQNHNQKINKKQNHNQKINNKQNHNQKINNKINKTKKQIQKISQHSYQDSQLEQSKQQQLNNQKISNQQNYNQNQQNNQDNDEDNQDNNDDNQDNDDDNQDQQKINFQSNQQQINKWNKPSKLQSQSIKKHNIKSYQPNKNNKPIPKFIIPSKKLFQTNYKSIELHKENQNLKQKINSQISSIYQNQSLPQLNQQLHQQTPNNNINYQTIQPNQNQHVSFQHIQSSQYNYQQQKQQYKQQYNQYHQIKNKNKNKNKIYPNQQDYQHDNEKQIKNFFHLNKNNNQNYKSKSQIKNNIFTPIKNKISPHKITKINHIYPQTTKIQKQKYLSNKNKKKNKTQQKTILKKSISPNQKQLNHQIFYRLYRQNTVSFRQKFKPQLIINPKQIQDQKTVFQSLQQKRQKYQYLSSNQKSQLFNKLYMTSTQSSMNRKNDSKYTNSSYSNQIQNIINQNTHKNKNYYQNINRAKPNMQSRVYSPYVSKRCNAHCQKFQYQNKQKQQKEKNKRKQQKLKQQIRSRSKNSLSISKSKEKKSGECQCCHKQKFQEQKKLQQLNRIKNKKTSYTKNTKYSIQKLFLPPNISFISDVLEQSYNQLFPDK